MYEQFLRAQVKNYMRQVYEYQVTHLTTAVRKRSGKYRYIEDTDWERGVFWSAVAQSWTETKEQIYLDGLKDYVTHTGFRPGRLPRFADAQVCINAYLDIYDDLKQPDILTYAKAHLDFMVKNPEPGEKDWYWCDALFMAPPAFFGMTKVTGERKYSEYAHKAFWEAFLALWDEETNLVYRDQRYVANEHDTELREANGEKVFWSRGLGWVLAAFPRIFRYLDSNNIQDQTSKEQFLAYFKPFAHAVSQYQFDDGFWRPSLLDPQTYPDPESSGTALLVYSIAWGYNQGYLDDSYLPVIIKGWQALVSSIHPTGMLGWVQLAGFSPQRVEFEHTMEYGVGGFLLAATEILKLDLTKVENFFK